MGAKTKFSIQKFFLKILNLNTKKSWHPSTLKNQERVWAAERAAEQERGRIAELQRERGSERERDELRVLGRRAGTLPDDAGDKLSWMYNQPNKSGNAEDYLLGKTIDKSYERLVAEDKHTVCKTQAAPKNHVEHEVIPFSIRNFRSAGAEAPGADAQVDMLRKQQEDPLVAIRRRELDARAQLLQNPLRLQQLTKLLREDQEKRMEKKEMKKSKKNKSELDALLAQKLAGLQGKQILASLLTGKSKKKKKKRQSDTDSNSEGEQQNKKKKKGKHSDSVEDKPSRHRSLKDTEEDLHRKKKRNSDSFSEQTPMKKVKSKNKKYSQSPEVVERSSRQQKDIAEKQSRKMSSDKKKRRSPSRSSENQIRKNYLEERKQRSRSRSPEKPNPKSHHEAKNQQSKRSNPENCNQISHSKTKRRSLSGTPERSGGKNHSGKKMRESRSGSPEKSSRKDRTKPKNRRSPSASPEKSRHKTKPKKRESRSISPKRTNKNDSREKDGRSRSTTPPSRPREASVPYHGRRDGSSDSDPDRRRPMNYGLVSADGRKLASNARPVDDDKNKKPTVKKESWRRPVPERLSSAEKELRLREMTSAAVERDAERSRGLARHRAAARRDEAAAAAASLDPHFAARQAARSAAGSLEQRIRSNVYNIQRSGRHMDVNFAKR